MRALLDTHTFFWAGQASRQLSRKTRDVLTNDSAELYVSAVTAWEIGTKVRKGKWPEAAALERDFVSIVTGAGFQLLSITVEHALLSARLPGDHRDPFDRMLAAQALTLQIPVISNDVQFDAFGVERIW